MDKKIILTLALVLLVCPVFSHAAGTVDVNTASLSQLDTLTGIGPVYAQRIIDGRPYSSIDDLDRVKGIGPATLQKIKDQGMACVNCANTSLRGASEASNEAIPAQSETDEIASSPEAPRNDAPTIIYSGGVFINEILPNPKGADGTDEWIELYNSNNFDVDLSDWQIQDTVGTTTTYTIPHSTGSGQAKILANNFLVLKRPDTKIMLNNDSDGLNLKTPDEKIVDSVNFTSAPLGQSYNKVGANWQWSTTLTPGAANIITKAIVAKSASASLPKTKKSDNSSKLAAVDLADLSQTINQDNGAATSPWFLFFSALAVTIILAALVLFVRIRFKNNKNLNI